MKTCKECLFWDKNNKCGRIGQWSESATTDEWAMTTDEGDANILGNTVLLTGPDFGCVLWERNYRK